MRFPPLRFSVVAVGEQTQEAQAASRGVYNVAAAGLQKIAQDGVIELYFDSIQLQYRSVRDNIWELLVYDAAGGDCSVAVKCIGSFV